MEKGDEKRKEKGVKLEGENMENYEHNSKVGSINS